MVKNFLIGSLIAFLVYMSSIAFGATIGEGFIMIALTLIYNELLEINSHNAEEKSK